MNKSAIQKHIIITGTGRAGTTFLVQLFGHLGFDTGFTLENLRVNEKKKCGLESNGTKKDIPYVIKDPVFCDYAERILGSKDIIIEYIIVPIRDLYSAAESRRQLQGKNKTYPIPGGLWQTKEPHAQEGILLKKIYSLAESASKVHVPIIFINFPMLVDDSSYLYEKLHPIVGQIPFMTFKTVFDGIIRPEWVHSFNKNE